MNTNDEEIVVIVFVGLAIITAGVAEALGVSDAIGAFMVGLILGATAKAARLRTLTHPLRDAFGAIFFFHFGLTINPGEVVAVLTPIAVAVVMTVVLATTAGVIAARMHGFDRTEAANIGFTVLTRGEFSIILASLAVAAGLDHRISSLAAGYVLVLAIVGPIAAAQSRRTAQADPRRSCSRRRGHARPGPPLDLEVGTGSLYRLGTELLQITVQPGSRLHGVYAAELRLPAGLDAGPARARRVDVRPAADHPAAHRRRAARLHPARAAGRRPRSGSSPCTARAGWRTGTATSGSRRMRTCDPRLMTPTSPTSAPASTSPARRWTTATSRSARCSSTPPARCGSPTATGSRTATRPGTRSSRSPSGPRPT